ncbi:cytochrome b-c1 complex subunit 6, mitochondrial-like [Arctopsyche grandis]|uniref:cytochrome b-c1 complex subunit 6, mitochondrial-like n=1 Tax=Arctopsyche grandis TaxID=121162 RepID=UPI00406D833B
MSEKKMSVFPAVKAQEEEEELIDPQQALRDKCAEGEKAMKLHEKFQACTDRVNSRKKTAETCSEELFDYFHVIDHCVAKDLFTKLK